MRLTSTILWLYRVPILGAVARQLLFLLGADIPRSVVIGEKFHLKHRGLGVVIHPATRIGNDVALFQGVTVGEAGVGQSVGFQGILLSDRSVIAAGAKILAPPQGLIVGEGTIIGANAVLLQSTGPWEVWVGVPARCVGQRVI